MNTVLFVCTGNTCRSSMAQGIFERLIAEDEKLKDIEVLSAGTGAYFSEPASHSAVQAAQELGIDLSKHVSTQVTAELIIRADLILTMTMSHKLRVLSMMPEAKDKTYTLKEFVMDDKTMGFDISDPFGASVEVYRECAKEIYDELLKAKDKMRAMKE